MTSSGLLLLADAGEVVFFLIVILFMIIGGLTQLFKKMQEGQQDPRRPRPGHRPGGPRPNVPAGQDPVRSEIERFLREAAGRQGGARPQQAQPFGPPPARPRPAPVALGRPLAGGPIVLEAIPEPASVADHVRQQVPGQPFARLDTDVGQRLARTDQEMAEHVHGALDHPVSRLEGTPGESAFAPLAEEAETPDDRVSALPPTAAAGLAAMLAEPVGLRQAIVLNEILQRPEHRWR